MLSCFIEKSTGVEIPITLLTPDEYQNWITQQSPFLQTWLAETGYRNEAGGTALIPDEKGKLSRVICCITDKKNFWGVGTLPMLLPKNSYYFDIKSDEYSNYAVAWGLGAYQFSRYKKPTRTPAQLVIPESVDANSIINIVSATYTVRDLINTPTDDLGPSELAKFAETLANKQQASFKQIIGENLLKENYASIYTVGRASDDAPRLIDIRWGNAKHPKIVLVGKGVCFDSGGLDLKSSSSMLLMKKDMGGAAHALGLAQMIMQAKLPVYLRVLLPVVENVISGNAYRPGDIIKSRKGLTIEIGNTDAEGRVILADALTEAVSDNPDLLIDISTLTGAARIALGTELPAVFSNNAELAEKVIQHANNTLDPIWQLPLFSLYRDSLNSSIADLNNCSTDAYGGAITAALFLKEFVPDHIPWLHFDLMAWNLKTRPGRPAGGEAMGLRALFSYLQTNYNSL